MKAIILAGGEGSRLRPLTTNTPKPLVRILDKPIMEYIIALLKEHNITDVAVTVRYLKDQIKEYFKESFLGVKLTYFEEDSALSTAGSVKAAESFFEGEESFLIISGDCICDFDLSSAINFHNTKNADLTMLLYESETPQHFGVVKKEDDGKITGFLEKPSWSQVFSNDVNTGIYILKTKHLALIENKVYDFSNELFPKMLCLGHSLYGYVSKGYWCDVGFLSSYYKCNRDALLKRFSSPLLKNITDSDYYAAPSCDIKNATVKNGSIIGSNSKINDGAYICGSIIGQNVTIGKSAHIISAIIGDGTQIDDGACVQGGSVIGKNCTIAKNTCISCGSVITDGNRMEASSYFLKEAPLFFADTIKLNKNSNIEKFVKLGFAVASALDSTIGVLCDLNENTQGFFRAFISGLTKNCASSVILGKGPIACARYASTVTKAYTVYLFEEKSHFCIKIFDKNGTCISRKLSNSIENAYFYKNCETNSSFSSAYLDILELYKLSILPHLPESYLPVTANDSKYSEIFIDILKRKYKEVPISKNENENLCFIFDDERNSVSLFWGGKFFIDENHIMLLIANEEMKAGRDIFAPFGILHCLENMAVSNNCKVHRYFATPTNDENEFAKKCSFGNSFFFDPINAAARILDIYSRKDNFLSLSQTLPQLCVLNYNIKIGSSAASFIKKLGQNGNESREGISVFTKEGHAFILPLNEEIFEVSCEASSYKNALGIVKSIVDKSTEFNLKMEK